MIRKTFLAACLMLFIMACQQESKDERIFQQTSKFTSTSCPKRMDKYTVLDSMVYTPATRTMSYYYSVSDNMDTDSAYTAPLRDLLGSSLLSNLRNNVGFKELKEHNVTFRYVYSSHTTDSIYTTFTFSPEEYK